MSLIARIKVSILILLLHSPLSFASDREVVLHGINSGQCGFSALLESGGKTQTPQAFLDAIEKANWDPCCISRDIKSWLNHNDRPVRGITLGFEVEASLKGYS